MRNDFLGQVKKTSNVGSQVLVFVIGLYPSPSSEPIRVHLFGAEVVVVDVDARIDGGDNGIRPPV